MFQFSPSWQRDFSCSHLDALIYLIFKVQVRGSLETESITSKRHKNKNHLSHHIAFLTKVLEIARIFIALIS